MVVLLKMTMIKLSHKIIIIFFSFISILIINLPLCYADSSDLARQYFVEGKSHYETQEYTSAIPLFQKSIETDNSKSEYFEYLASSYEQLKDFTNAIKNYEKALRARDKSEKFGAGLTHFFLGRLYLKTNKYKDAIDALENSLKIANQRFKDNASFLRIKADIYILLRDAYKKNKMFANALVAEAEAKKCIYSYKVEMDLRKKLESLNK